jgi:hypothetical protein
VPHLAAVLTPADLHRPSRAPSALDLSPYLHLLSQVLAEGGVGAVIELDPGDSSRVVKGRLTRAARELGRQLIWRTAPKGQLRFVLAEPGGPIPGGRPRRPRAEVEAEQTMIDAVLTPEVADVTDTDAATEEEDIPLSPRRRRARKTS